MDALLKRALQYDKRKLTNEEKKAVKYACKHGVKEVVIHTRKWKYGKPLIADEVISVGEIWLKQHATEEEKIALFAYRLRGLVRKTKWEDVNIKS